MTLNDPSPFSAANAALGYLFQCRYALFATLQRMRREPDVRVALEALDDIEFTEKGLPVELLQTKHHVRKAANLTDTSPDLWKTVRIWSEAERCGDLGQAACYLVTTSVASVGTAAALLRPGERRDPEAALTRLLAAARSSTSAANTPAYTSFLSLLPTQQQGLLERVFLFDSSPTILGLDALLAEEIFWAVDRQFIAPFLESLEGWWFRRVIQQLAGASPNPITGFEMSTRMSDLREQFKRDALPIDDTILAATIDSAAYRDRPFVHQLKLLNVRNQRILTAIREYFRAYHHRSKWVREELILVGDLDRYQTHLIEEWRILFDEMCEELGDNVTEEARVAAARRLYRWVEQDANFPIRLNCTEPFVTRGTYQILADRLEVGWHADFLERLRGLLHAATR